MSRAVIWPWAIAGILLSALLMLAAEKVRRAEVVNKPLLNVVFEHADHKDTKCATCHHNFLDDSGGGTCYNCHKYTPEIAADIEKIFHDFCFDCHVEKSGEGEGFGPMRQCSGCH